MVKLVLLRHGQSTANEANIYTGWSDMPLTQYGCQQARKAGRKILQNNLQFTQVHTSVLARAIKTANLVMQESKQLYLPISKTWRLNERHYGALRGLNKDFTKKKYGEKQVALWRRSFDAKPPLLDHPIMQRRYEKIPYDVLPVGESLRDASERILPYWVEKIAPQLIAGNNQLIVAHGSTLRALIKYIEKISDENIDGVEVANAQPIVYTLNKKLEVIDKKVL